jgi:outer membrane protein OmpA-like peptidoglycan-associated protein
MLCTAAPAQDLSGTIGIGARGGVANYQGDDFDSAKLRGLGSFYGEQYLSNRFSLETALNIGQLAAKTGAQDFRSHLTSLSLLGRLALLSGTSVRPYVTAGGEIVGIDPSGPENSGFDRNGFAIPLGGGISFGLSESAFLDFRGLYHYSFKDRFDGNKSESSDDAFVTGTVGLTWLTGTNKDRDGDGLTNAEEKKLGTNPKAADTDGDGLRDGEEVMSHRTDPLKADSDADGLSDFDEINKHKTDPNRADSDGDGLNDGVEITKHSTDPVKADSDGDGLKDGDEIMRHNTNPSKADSDGDGLGDGEEINNAKTDALKADTDGDGLKDGDEVNRHKTDPLIADTDKGSVDDGAEVTRGTNPLVAADDVAKPEPAKEILQVEVGKAIVLEGVVFKSGSAVITPQSEEILNKALNTLNENPEIEVEIQGHTDNTGSRAVNTRLSQARAEAVKAWLVKKGTAASRITTKGFGPEKPVASNDTPEGRQKNRRIEFARIK